MQIEILQEISNIGVGHAATALSQLLHRRVDMSIPFVEIVEFDKLGERLAGSDEAISANILVDTYNFDEPDKMLNFLLIFNEETIKNILKILRVGETTFDITQLDELSESIIEETGNILLLHTITAINSFSDTNWFPSPPQCTIDMVGATIDEIIGRGKYEKNVFLLVECDVFTDEDKLKGIILIIPNEGALELIMAKLYGEDYENMME